MLLSRQRLSYGTVSRNLVGPGVSSKVVGLGTLGRRRWSRRLAREHHSSCEVLVLLLFIPLTPLPWPSQARLYPEYVLSASEDFLGGSRRGTMQLHFDTNTKSILSQGGLPRCCCMP